MRFFEKSAYEGITFPEPPRNPTMHLPDAVLSGPVVAATGVLATAGLGFCLARVRGQLHDRSTVLMGMMAAFVFAAQMVNFPVLPGVTGHLLGGVLSAVVLGPWAGAVVIATVLLVQALLFADGGITALGANFLNMGMVGACVGYAVYSAIRRALGHGHKGILLGAMLAAWISVLLSAACCAIQLAAFGRWEMLPPILGWMLLVHAVIGLCEAVITGLLLQAVLAARPDVIPGLDASSHRSWLRWGQSALAGFAAALAVAVFLAPLAWEEPDGLEFVENKLQIEPATAATETPGFAPMTDYQLPLPGIDSLKVATATAGAVGTCVVFAVAAALAHTLSRRLASMNPPASFTADGSPGVA